MYKQHTLTELMALAGIQVVTSPSNGDLTNPKDIGTGFLLHHKGEIFFVTVRHVVNSEIKGSNNQLIDDDKKLAIITNRYRFNEKGMKEGELYSLGGFYTFEFFNLLHTTTDVERVEVAFSLIEKNKLKDIKIQTAGVKNYETGEIIVDAGQDKIILDSGIKVVPSENDLYYCSGFVQAHWEELATSEKVLAYRYIFHNDMKFDRIDGDFIVLKTTEYASKHNWGGLSGSPVINQDGGLIGVLNGGKDGTHEIYVLSMDKILMLMDNVLKIETLNRINMAHTYKLEEIYNLISEEQAKELEQMINEVGEEDAALKWLEDKVAPTLPITPYDGNIGDDNTTTKPFSKRVRDELNMLICGHPKYKEERDKILDQYHGWTLYAATAAAALLGSLFGVSATVLSPAILLFVRLACKISINAYCQNVNFEDN